VLEVEPASAGRLSGLIEDFKAREQLTTPTYQRLKDGMPTLHFMSLSVFNGADYDPVFVIEVNFDYRAGPFWAQFEATVGDQMRPMLRCCKRPMDSAGPLYDAVTAAGSGYPIAPYLENRTLAPSVYHHGNRGLSRDRILREGELFLATRTELAQPSPTAANPYRGIPAEQIHAQLRTAMLGKFPWLEKPELMRITRKERAVDVARLFGLLLAVLFALSIPGMSVLVFLRAFFPSYASWFLQDWYALLLLLVIPLFAGVILYAKASARPGEAASSRSGGLTPSFDNQFTSLGNPVTLAVVAIIAIALVAAVFGVAGAALASVYDVVLVKTIRNSIKAYDAAHAGFFDAVVQAAKAWNAGIRDNVEHFYPAAWIDFVNNLYPMFRLALIGIYTVFMVSFPAIFVWLRWLERRDSHHDAPPVDQRELRKMTHREDWIPQNHMGSVVLVKPGVLRMALFRTGHLGLGLLLRVIATDGYLGSMRTVHFAHWAFVNNGSRLMFFSNFDHSWDSYLDDFIEKAHGGLTLAWGSGVGFPPTRFLVMDGASHGRQFKTWARHSMAVSRFWFSAYTEYTVDQVERQARIANGLRKASLTPTEAVEWAKDL
jgi:hypothetical protein